LSWSSTDSIFCRFTGDTDIIRGAGGGLSPPIRNPACPEGSRPARAPAARSLPTPAARGEGRAARSPPIQFQQGGGEPIRSARARREERRQDLGGGRKFLIGWFGGSWGRGSGHLGDGGSGCPCPPLLSVGSGQRGAALRGAAGPEGWGEGTLLSPGAPAGPPRGRARRPSRPSDVRPSWARGASPEQGSTEAARWRREAWGGWLV